MRHKQLSSWLLLAMIMLFATGCGKDPAPEPLDPTGRLSSEILGNWIMPSGSLEDWTIYTFHSSAGQMEVEISSNGQTSKYTGLYVVDDPSNTVTGSYRNGNLKTIYIDWKVKTRKAFEMILDVYSGQDMIGDTKMYRLVETHEIEVNSTFTPNYRALTGSTDCSYSVVGSGCIAVDGKGEVTALEQGTAFILASTPDKGEAAIRIDVIGGKTTMEMLLGTWVYNNLKTTEWQRTVLGADDYYYADFDVNNNPLLGGTARGTWTLSDDIINVNVKFGDGTPVLQQLRITELSEYNFVYDAYTAGTFIGNYMNHKLLKSYDLSPEQEVTPDYSELVEGASITGYSSQDPSIATADDNSGTIKAVKKGRTYIEILTGKGAAVIEINVKAK